MESAFSHFAYRSCFVLMFRRLNVGRRIGKARTFYQHHTRIYCLCIVTALPNETATWENIAAFFVPTRVMCFTDESEELQLAFPRMQYIPEALARKALVRNKQMSSIRMSSVATEWKICFDRLATLAFSFRRSVFIDCEMKKRENISNFPASNEPCFHLRIAADDAALKFFFYAHFIFQASEIYVCASYDLYLWSQKQIGQFLSDNLLLNFAWSAPREGYLKLFRMSF